MTAPPPVLGAHAAGSTSRCRRRTASAADERSSRGSTLCSRSWLGTETCSGCSVTAVLMTLSTLQHAMQIINRHISWVVSGM